LWRALESRAGLFAIGFGRVRAQRARVPFNGELLAGLLRRPPAVSDNRQGIELALRHEAGVNRHHRDHALHRLHRLVVERGDGALKHRTGLERGMDHSRKLGIDAEQGLTADNGRRIDPAPRSTDDLEGIVRLERHGVQRGGRDLRGDRSQRGISRRPPGRRVPDHSAACGQRRRLYNPLARRGHDEHRPGSCTSLPHRQPVRRRGAASTRTLPAVLLLVGQRLLDVDLLPVNVEFLGDKHRQHRLHALPDFGILGTDDDAVVGIDADEGIEHRPDAFCLGLARQRQ